MALQAEDLFIGRYVTVVKGAKTRVRSAWFGSYETEQSVLCASVLRVVGLSLPYVAVECLYCMGGHVQPGTRLALDTRVMQFALVDESYARALVPPQLLQPTTVHTPKPLPPPPSQWGRSFLPDDELEGYKYKKEIAQIGASPLPRPPGTLEKFQIAKADCEICGGENFEHATTCVRHPKNRKKHGR